MLVTPEQAGERLDRYVAGQVPDLTRSQVKNLIEAGHILVNERSVRPSHLLRPGDAIHVLLPEPQPVGILPEDIALHIVYEDDDVVVVDKPAGMVVHPAPGHTRGTLVHALLHHYPDMQIGSSLRPGIVHRLDQGTSGLLVVARNDYAMRLLTTQQKERQMHKVYLAVVEGRMKETAGVIDAPIGRHPVDRKRQAVVANGRVARTHFCVLEELGSYTLVEVTLETGRTHQIRVHFSHQHHPVLCDPLYGPRRPRARFGLDRQFLHAHKLGFVLPGSGVWHEYTSPLPPDLATALEKLRTLAGGTTAAMGRWVPGSVPRKPEDV